MRCEALWGTPCFIMEIFRCHFNHEWLSKGKISIYEANIQEALVKVLTCPTT